MTAADAARCGGLCALTFDRDELRRRAVDAPAFRAALESAPEIRGIIDDFYGSRYASAMEALREARPASISTRIFATSPTSCSAPSPTRVGAVRLAVRHRGPREDGGGVRGRRHAGERRRAGEGTGGVDRGGENCREDRFPGKDPLEEIVRREASAYERAISAGREHRAECRAALVRAALVESDLIVRAGPGAEGARTIRSRREARARGRGEGQTRVEGGEDGGGGSRGRDARGGGGRERGGRVGVVGMDRMDAEDAMDFME